ECRVGLESTIVDLTSDAPRILRSGPLTRQQIEAVLGEPVAQPEHHDVAVAGNMKVHYQPRTPLYVMSRESLVAYVRESTAQRLVVLSYSTAIPEISDIAVQRAMPQDKAAYASGLYRQLHELDELKADAILLEQPPTDED